MLIDMHCHTTEKKLWGLHTESATIADLTVAARKYDIRKIVLLATCFPFKGTGLINQALWEKILGNDLFLAFGTLNAMTQETVKEGVAELRDLLKRELIAGIKLYPGYQDFRKENESGRKLNPVYELAREFNVPVMVHSGELHHCCPKEQRENGTGKCGEICWVDRLKDQAHPVKLMSAAVSYPDVKFIFSHLGNPFFNSMRRVMEECPNVYTDISGQYLSGTSEDSWGYRFELKLTLKEWLEKPGFEDRILFGTDFPIMSHKDAIDLVDSLLVSEEVKEKIRWKNAARVLKLDLRG